MLSFCLLFILVLGHGLAGRQKKRKGRNRTAMHNVYDRKGQPPVPVSFNEKGQPDGKNASECEESYPAWICRLEASTC